MFGRQKPNTLVATIAASLHSGVGWTVRASSADHDSGLAIEAYSERAVSITKQGASVRGLDLSRADRRLLWDAFCTATQRTVASLLEPKADAPSRDVA